MIGAVHWSAAAHDIPWKWPNHKGIYAMTPHYTLEQIARAEHALQLQFGNLYERLPEAVSWFPLNVARADIDALDDSDIASDFEALKEELCDPSHDSADVFIQTLPPHDVKKLTLRLTDMMSSIKTRIEINQKDRHNG
jgi:hypothetical protein